MKNSSFSCLRSINNQLHNKLSQQNQYQSYLKRIDNIVDRKPSKDTSPQYYMNFLNKCKKIARIHKESQQEIKLVQENRILLEKIMQTRNKKFQPPSQSYHLNMHQKRNREIEKINDQNMRIAKRITQQYSHLRKSLYPKQQNKIQKEKSIQKKSVYASWNYSPLKQRKLPKLVQLSKKSDNQTKSFDDNNSSLNHVYSCSTQKQKSRRTHIEKQQNPKNNQSLSNSTSSKVQNNQENKL